MDCIISIELGTNAVRIYAFDLDGNVIGSAKGAYPTFHPDPDYSEQDPEQIFITMLYILKNFLSEKIHPKNHKVISICFSAAMHSVLAIDKNGVPLGNAITWADNRGKKEAQALKNSKLGNAIYKATGTPIHPMSPLIKITWLKNSDKDRFRRTWKFLSIKSYIIQQLADDYVIDYSLASATGLLNIHKKTWEPDSLKYAGITADKLPDLVPVYHSQNKLRKEYQTLLGLSAKTKIMVGSSDGCLASLGSGAWKKDKATITIEDSGAMRVIGKQVLQDKQQRFFNYILDDNYYVSGGPTNNGGLVLEWFAKQFGDFKNAFDIESSMEELIREASGVSAGAEGLLFLPYLLGERAPIWNANARGVYFGLNINHERKHFIRATVEGILYQVYSIGKTLQEHRTISSISANGSFASIPFCTQMIADIFNKPVSISKNSNTVSFGAFLLSAVEMGIYKSVDESTKSIVLAETFNPNKQNHSVYKKYTVIFERLSMKLSEEFEGIVNLQ